jgi:hypothetical protein
VLYRERLKRIEPWAAVKGTPIARRTCEGSSPGFGSWVADVDYVKGKFLPTHDIDLICCSVSGTK